MKALIKALPSAEHGQSSRFTNLLVLKSENRSQNPVGLALPLNAAVFRLRIFVAVGKIIWISVSQ